MNQTDRFALALQAAAYLGRYILKAT